MYFQAEHRFTAHWVNYYSAIVLISEVPKCQCPVKVENLRRGEGGEMSAQFRCSADFIYLAIAMKCENLHFHTQSHSVTTTVLSNHSDMQLTSNRAPILCRFK